MDTKTPPILLKHHQERKFQNKRLEKTTTTSGDITLPPLTPLPNGNSRTKIKNSNSLWTHGAPNIANNQEHFKKRPYRVLHIGATPLMHACQQGDRSRVLRLLQEQQNTIGYRDRTLRSALHYCMDAATGGAVASAAPELVNAPDSEGHTPLHLAVIAGDTQLVAVLLANGADVNAKDLEGHSVLHWATVCGEAECVRLILAAGARPSTPDHRGGSPLHYAAQCCGAAVTAELSVPKKIGFKVLQTLLEFDADVNAKDEDGRQPILWAASAGSVEAVLALARSGGAAAAGATDKDGLTALHCAASRGHTRCVEALVNFCDAQPDHVDDNGCSALHYAATLGHADATALLLRLGADPNRQDRKGRTPALCAAAKGQLETLKILAQHGGSLHARTVRGTGVAHEAVLSGRIELIEWLAKKKPTTLDVATHDGRTPLHVAALHGYLDACKVLLDHGARIDAIFRTSKSGSMTPLDAALYRGHRDCAKLIQMHGGMTAHHLRTHRTAPNKVFAAKLKVKRRDSSSGSDSYLSGESTRRKPDVYIEKHWIEKRTRKRSSPRKYEDRRGSKSFSEEEVRLSKSCQRDRRRRARSESARYEESKREKSERKQSCGRKYSKHEYGESSSELDDTSSEDVVEGKTERSSSRRRRRNSSQNEDDDDGISDDSLEVVTVRRSLEKKSEKVKYSGRKSKTPRETSKETRITETKRRSSKIKTKAANAHSEDKNIGASAKSRESKSGILTEKKADNLTTKKENSTDEKSRRGSRFRKDTTDSTSQETVETVTVTALVHKDQPPDTPTLTATKSEKRKSEGQLFNEEIMKTRIDDVLEKADEMQSALMTKAADLKKNADKIRRKMTEELPIGEDANDDNDDVEDDDEDDDDDDNDHNLEENAILKGRRDDESKSDTTTEDSQLEYSQLQSQPEDEANSDQPQMGTLGDNGHEDSPQSMTRKESKLHREKKEEEEEEGDDDDDDKNGESSSVAATTVKDKFSVRNEETSNSNSDISDKELDKSSDTVEKSEQNKNHEPRRSSTEINTKSNTIEDDRDEQESPKSITPLAESTPVEIKSEEPVPLEKSHDEAEKQKNADSSQLAKTGDDKANTAVRSIKSDNLRYIDSSSSSAKSVKRQQHSRPSTGKGRRSDGARSKSPSKHSLFESSGEPSPDRSAIVAVIESPEWDEEDEEIAKEIRDVVGDSGDLDSEAEDDDSLGVLRVIRGASDEEASYKPKKLLKPPTNDTLPRVDHKITASPHGLYTRTKQRRDSGGRDSGIEPSPRVSKIPKRMLKCSPNTEKHHALNIDTVTRDVQISLRRYHLERKIFFQLMELKRLQIRHGRANEQVLVKRQVEVFHKAGMTGPTLGVTKYDQPYTFRHFETFLYEQLRRLQKRPATPDWCTDPKHCTQKTHRCHHATSAYTSMPIYTYLGGECQERDERTLLPRIESRGKGQMTVEVTRGDERQVIALPAEKLDRTKRYFVTFTVRGENQESEMIKTPRNAQRNTKSV
ncbi:hypothetical protein PV327_000764 [Microctonus hyperodae]|uniref:Ankycorbin n=1 Tax=Microctonus hyperodae TaxID=165561 RepID=A0AA39L2H4_MICHY|nr:hypothetical protein PV327_000764 [Microctonus hyperodae]